MLKKFLALLVLFCYFSASALSAGIYLTDAEMKIIRQELDQMSAATTRLQNELRAQRDMSRTLLEMSEKLQEKLESALMMLEASEKSLAISEVELTAFLTELAKLRTEYSALWESWTMQKNETRKWKRLAAAGWISAALVLAGGFLLGGIR